jgi:hypothetical protein
MFPTWREGWLTILIHLTLTHQYPILLSRLLLVHGLIDENVHFRHTARLINALIAARKRYDLVLFPCERHSPHKLQDRIYMEECICSYFNDHLQYRESTAPTVTSSPSLLLDSNTPAMKSVTLSAHLWMTKEGVIIMIFVLWRLI